MFLKNSKYATLALTLALTNIYGLAHADFGAVKPYTASELPIMAQTPNLVYGSYGPQLRLNSKTFQSIPDAVYFEKSLEEQLANGPITVNNINISFTGIINKANITTTSANQMDLETIKTLTKDHLHSCQEAGYLCDAAINLNGTDLNIIITPLTVESVNITGKDEWQQKTLEYQLRGIKAGEPLNLKKAEKHLRLTQANPDLTFETSLEVIPYTHQIKVNVNAPDHKVPIHVVGSFNNLDQMIFGDNFLAVTGITNNVTNHGDSLMIAGVKGRESMGLFTRYEFPINPALRTILEYQYAQIEPDNTVYSNYDTEGEAYRISAGMKYTLLDQPSQRLSTDLNFDLKQATANSAGDLIEREALRTIRLGFNYDKAWETTSFTTRQEFGFAFPILSGSLANDPRLSWFNGGSQYWRYTGFAALNKTMKWNSTGSLIATWQYSPDGLSNFDVGGVGGTFLGRGYREVYYFADSYAAVTAQWQVPAYFIPKGIKLPFSDKSLRDATQVLAFVDYGYADANNSPAGYDGTDHILSTGVGIRTQLTNRVSARLDVGFPLLRQLPFQQGARLHFGIDAALF